MPYIVIVIIALLWLNTCQKSSDKIQSLKTEMSIDSLDFVTKTSKDGKLIVRQNVKIISDANTMKRLVAEVEGVRKINRQIKATTHTSISNVTASPVEEIEIKKDTIYLDTSKVINNYLKLPQSYVFSNEWNYTKHSIDIEGNSTLDSNLFINKPMITFGYKDSSVIANLFKRPIAVVTYTDKNPYTKVKGLENLEFKQNKKWYQKKGAWFISGVLLGGSMDLLRKN